MHGLLLFLTSEHPKAVVLREAVIIKIVPMLNPDGVFAGNYRCNSLGLDLNRRWHEGSPWSVPTVHAVRELAKAYVALPNAYNLEVFVDIHAHSTTMNGFVFANVPADPRQLEAVTAFPRVLGNHARDLAFSGCKLDNDPSKAGTGRRVLGEVTGRPLVHPRGLLLLRGRRPPEGRGVLAAAYTEMGNAIGSAPTSTTPCRARRRRRSARRRRRRPRAGRARADARAPAERRRLRRRAPRAPSASSDRETRANAEVLRERLDREHRANAILAAAERTARCSARSLTAAAAAPAAARGRRRAAALVPVDRARARRPRRRRKRRGGGGGLAAKGRTAARRLVSDPVISITCAHLYMTLLARRQPCAVLALARAAACRCRRRRRPPKIAVATTGRDGPARARRRHRHCRHRHLPLRGPPRPALAGR